MLLGAQGPATDALDAGVIGVNPHEGHSRLRQSHRPHAGATALDPLPELGRSGGSAHARLCRAALSVAATVRISSGSSSGKQGNERTSEAARVAWGKARSASGMANMGWAGMGVG